jgi:type II secretory pathway predicted ATPase ExeA
MFVSPAPLPDGAQPVATVTFDRVQQFAGEVVEHRGFLEVSGRPGHGKTYAVDTFCASAGALGIDVVKFSLASRAKGYSVVRTILRDLGASDTGDGDALERRIVQVMNAYPRDLLLYGDEADLINRDGLRVLRLLRDSRDENNHLLRFGLVLVGSDFRAAYRLAPELESRVTRRVKFGPIEDKRLVATIRNFHPLYQDVSADLIRRIDGEHCHGEWRQWRTVTDTCLTYMRDSGETQFTMERLSAALGAIEG